ncbi:MAG: ATP-dependent zinc metalloprotease FtsH [Hyphomonadaceae bacterium]|nr:ATP-dependent zinc metalloprotease FtsH [Hyphomonadaceae bacterium]
MNMRNMALLGVVLFLLIALVTVMTTSSGTAGATEITYSEFQRQVDSGQIKDATIKGNKVSSVVNGQRQVAVFREMELDFASRLQTKGVNVKVEDAESGGTILSYFISALPLLFIVGLWFFLMRQMQGGGGRAMSFGKSKARLLTEKHGRVTFDDVAGVDEAKEELEEIADSLKDPTKFHRLGGKIPKGALLVGPPGTGKTLIARAVAGEANVPFFTISGSDFVEMFVGVGASRVRDMFEQAKKNAPCIIFIDEIDAVGRHRGAGLGGGNDEREQTLNQLLVEMDGFEANEGIIIIAATNRPDVLDPALLRPGRFDRQVTVGNPDIVGREKILKVHMRNVPLSKDVEPKTIARGTPGFSGADLANLVNEAALLAARRGKRSVGMREFEDAKDKVMMGPERKSMVMTQKEKEATAVHEAGHAIVNMLVAGNDPLHKVTIIPRGRALGVTWSLPEADRLSYTKTWAEAKIAMAFGGRIAEQLVYGEEHLNTGASSDITQATSIARSMVTEWGMSELLGPLRYSPNEQEVFLGHSVTQRQNVSSETARMIDQEVRRIVTDGEKKARQVLTDNRHLLDQLAAALMEYETLSGDEVSELFKGNRPDRPDDTPSGPTSAVPVIKKKPPREGFGGEPEPQPT